ncbi:MULTISPECIES: TonB-dependent siderophore receptor [Halomonadaceae]|uniref:TonB-dependent siderophore receptor n=1 Tax=Halomonadaceae TaxID=28256 RepID=UPI0012F2B879|nr:MULTISPECIES: TonB-dependent siderophore receptor [Halomonas]CAD5273919.1 TonB-dependent receptor, beta-barrel [Halomonas sp. 156]CAD5277554.1 TonB-dependent receptor, beta-barrel [Halomonas sp. 113]CAD5278882.1 TonB-dependent receptor, beta-barrel [Halomonas sp. 59]CAD5284768.1 TonB-dependent receptor, beta-barrel [Halomonas sp. I3]VXA98964.1 TonB-dependent receptor, beta-barrel [Halomonas titanicae]
MNQPSFRKRWLTTAIAVAACSAPTAVLAQDAEQRASSGSGSSTELPTLQVTESRIYEEATGPVEGYVATRTATGTKTDTPINEVPQSISVITRDEVEARGAQSIGDVLSYTAGVEGHANGLDPRRDVISIRGFGGTEYFYRDGLRLTGFSNQGKVVSEPYGLERIEVLRGPASVLYGQGGPGGIVNLVSKKPTETPQGEVRVSAGSHDHHQVNTDVSGYLDEQGELKYRFAGLLREANAEIDYMQNDRTYLAPSFSWTPNDRTSLTLLAEYKNIDTIGSYIALPRLGTLDNNPNNGKIPRSRYVGEPDTDNFEQDYFSVASLFEHKLNDTVTIRQNTRYRELETDITNTYAGQIMDDLRTVPRFGLGRNEKIDAITTDNQLQFDIDTQGVDHKILVGVDWQRANNDLTYYSVQGFTPLDIFDPVYGTSSPTQAVSARASQELEQTGLYIQDQIKMDDRWALTLAGRHDWSSQTNRDRIENTENKASDSEFTYRAGLAYTADNGLTPYIGYSTSFLPVVGQGADGTTFEPETAQQYETGIKYLSNDGNLSITGSIFDLTRQNVTTADLDNPGFNQQTGEWRSRGLELEARASLPVGLDLVASYTYLDLEVTESNGDDLGKRPIDQPENMANLWANYNFSSGIFNGLGLGAGVRYIGSSYYDSANENSLPSTTLFDTSVSYDFSKVDASFEGWHAQVNANNVTDKEYISNCGYFGDSCKYGVGRNVIGTISYDW